MAIMAYYQDSLKILTLRLFGPSSQPPLIIHIWPKTRLLIIITKMEHLPQRFFEEFFYLFLKSLYYSMIYFLNFKIDWSLL